MRNEKSLIETKPGTFFLRPSPTCLDTPLRGEREIEHHRRLYCGHYSACLDQSVREGWPGFTCLNCPLRDLASGGPGTEPFAFQRRTSNTE